MSRAEVTSPGRLNQPPLKLFGDMVPAASVDPATARAIVNGVRCRLRHWTAADWRKLPTKQRPATTLPDQYGGYFALEPTRD